jgi:hypothetical protein
LRSQLAIRVYKLAGSIGHRKWWSATGVHRALNIDGVWLGLILVVTSTA